MMSESFSYRDWVVLGVWVVGVVETEEFCWDFIIFVNMYVFYKL